MNRYFIDFSDDIVEFEIIRNEEIIGETYGLSNVSDRKNVWHINPETNVQIHDILKDTKSNKMYRINEFELIDFGPMLYCEVFYTQL